MGILGKLNRMVEKFFIRDDVGIEEKIRNRVLYFPPDKNQEPCLLDDIVWYDGHRHTVVAISHKGSIAIRHINRVDGKGAFWVKSKNVSHEKD